MVMKDKPKLLDVVSLMEDLPERKLRRGQVGTIVENLATDVFEIEFADVNGCACAYAMLALRADQLMVSYYRPSEIA